MDFCRFTRRGLTPRWSQRRLPLEFMDGLSYTTIIEFAEPPAGRRGSAFFVRPLRAMTRTSKSFSATFGGLIVLIVVGLLFFRSAGDGRTPAERQQIADALLSMLRSPSAQELDDIKLDDIKPDDPRIPQVIRSLHPVRFTFSDSAAVIYCAGTPAEYILRRGKRNHKIWTLSIAGPGGISCRGLLSFEHD